MSKDIYAVKGYGILPRPSIPPFWNPLVMITALLAVDYRQLVH